MAGEGSAIPSAFHSGRFLVAETRGPVVRGDHAKKICRDAFKSVPEPVAVIDGFISLNNAHPRPFVWTQNVREILDKVGRCKAIVETLHWGRKPASKPPERTIRREGPNAFAQPRRKRNIRSQDRKPFLKRKALRVGRVHKASGIDPNTRTFEARNSDVFDSGSSCCRSRRR